MQNNILKGCKTEVKKNTRVVFVNTDASTLVGSVKVGETSCSLYRSVNYKYKYVTYVGEMSTNANAADVSFESAKKWAKENLSAEEYKKEFTIIESDNISPKKNFNINGDGFTVFERIRGNTNKSMGEILVDMIDYYEQTHGSLNE